MENNNTTTRGGGKGGSGGGGERGRGRGRGRSFSTQQQDQQQQHYQSQGRGGLRGRGASSRGRERAGRGGGPAATIPIYVPRATQTTATTTHLPESRSVSMPQSSSPEFQGRLPLKRPDNGGKSASRLVHILVNHFRVKFNSQLAILHYDVDIRHVRPKHGGNIELSKSDMCMIRNKFFADNPTCFPLTKTAYDGERNIFSAVELPTGIFEVEVPEGEDLKACRCTFTLKFVKKLELHKLEDYLNGNISLVPREILQGMDLIMKESLTRNWISLSRSFYSRDFQKYDDLGNGIIASKGFRESLKPTSQGLVLSVDFSVLPLLKPVTVIEFLRANLQMTFNIREPLRYWEKKNIEKALKGFRVTVNHRKTNQKYRIVGLTRDVSRDIKFSLDDVNCKNKPRDVGLVDYFRGKYNKDIQYKFLPCLDLSKNKKMNYVPMELCVLAEGQRFPKENLDWQASQSLKKRSLVHPQKRMQEICNIVKAKDGPRGGEVSENFEISVSTEMTEVMGRVIGPPALKLGDAKGNATRFTCNRDYQWNFVGKTVLQGKQIDRWAVLDFSSTYCNKLSFENFREKLTGRCTELGMYMKEPLFCHRSTMEVLLDTIALHDLLKHVGERSDQIARGGLQILICVMTKKDPGYKNLKRISETEIGILTQCCLVNNANKCDRQFLANMALKMNAKLGGNNMELFDRLPGLKGEGHVMFIGADVNHPGSWNKSSPSIAAVVASMNWPASNRYVAQIRPQDHRTEKIQNFGEMCLELLSTYARFNKVMPEKIVVFRDGVSEGQFDMVLNKELTDLKNAINLDGYSPTITVIVAQKRHQTRLFPKDEKSGAHTGNVFAGTVVDTTIVSQWGFDFFLVSHHGNLGTSKPTHYHVLYDEQGFTSDEMQMLIYNLCYTFARCTKPVSLVPPVYYADLAAYRGRLYHDALLDMQSPASTLSSFALSPSSTSSSSSSSSSLFDHRFFKLHNNLKNVMFFC